MVPETTLSQEERVAYCQNSDCGIILCYGRVLICSPKFKVPFDVRGIPRIAVAAHGKAVELGKPTGCSQGVALSLPISKDQIIAFRDKEFVSGIILSAVDPEGDVVEIVKIAEGPAEYDVNVGDYILIGLRDEVEQLTVEMERLVADRMPMSLLVKALKLPGSCLSTSAILVRLAEEEEDKPRPYSKAVVDHVFTTIIPVETLEGGDGPNFPFKERNNVVAVQPVDELDDGSSEDETPTDVKLEKDGKSSLSHSKSEEDTDVAWKVADLSSFSSSSRSGSGSGSSLESGGIDDGDTRKRRCKTDSHGKRAKKGSKRPRREY
jgi:hypothetical protein